MDSIICLCLFLCKLLTNEPAILSRQRISWNIDHAELSSEILKLYWSYIPYIMHVFKMCVMSCHLVHSLRLLTHALIIRQTIFPGVYIGAREASVAQPLVREWFKNLRTFLISHPIQSPSMITGTCMTTYWNLHYLRMLPWPFIVTNLNP